MSSKFDNPQAFDDFWEDTIRILVPGRTAEDKQDIVNVRGMVEKANADATDIGDAASGSRWVAFIPVSEFETSLHKPVAKMRILKDDIKERWPEINVQEQPSQNGDVYVFIGSAEERGSG